MTTKEQRKEYYLKNKEHIKEKSRQWHKDNLERKKQTSKLWRERHLERSLFSAAKQRCSQTGLSFNIELSDIIIPEYCPYLKVKLNRELGKGRTNLARRYSPTLDRIDSSKGYVKGNIQVLSWLANTMKSCATKEELYIFAQSIMETRYVL